MMEEVSSCLPSYDFKSVRVRVRVRVCVCVCVEKCRFYWFSGAKPTGDDIYCRFEFVGLKVDISSFSPLQG